MSALEQSPTPAVASVFDRILCVAGTSADDAEAARQAAVIAGRGARVSFVAVAPERHPATHPRPQEEESLEAADALAAKLGVRSDPHVVEAPDAVTGMLARSAVHDLLVTSPSTDALAALPRSPIPVLIARRPPEATTFASSILIAVDESPEARRAARIGGLLAARHDAVVALVATPEHDLAHRRALEGHVAAVATATGSRPLVLDEQSPAVPAIVAAAATTDASLIVLGSRPGIPEWSVSAHVARTAPCSVLVLRPPRR